jgi:ATP-dependent helicase Lhr and Lhr-like helicase
MAMTAPGKAGLPSRLPSKRMVYCGRRLVLMSRRNGGILDFSLPPNDPRLSEYLRFTKVLLGREFLPEKIVSVETINGKPALESEYGGALREFGFQRYHKGWELTRRY